MRMASKMIALVCMLLFSLSVQANIADDKQLAEIKKANSMVPSKKCNKCHDDEDDKTWEYDEGALEGITRNIYIPSEKFEKSVHGEQNCAACHDNVSLTKGEHDEYIPVTVGCIQCHNDTIDEQKGQSDPKYKRLDVVVEQTKKYMHSVHARPNIADQSKTNATCYDCHDPHNIGAPKSEARAEHRLQNPEVCGECHKEQKEDYMTSIHGQEVMEKNNIDAAVCSDCHTNHDIASPEEDKTKLIINENCGECHEDALKTYRASYHGQVNRLGFTSTAKCYDCHGSHDMKKADDPTSKVHADNRLETCQQCHDDASDNFISYRTHADIDDFDKNPIIWATAKFMQILIYGVFGFFWTHVILWGFREFRDRQQGKGYIPPEVDDTVYVQRFTVTWRILHLLFAMSTMTLALSGSTLIFSHTAWAPFVINLLGGPETEAIIHRTAGVIWLGVFLTHFMIAMKNIATNDKFRWFGPESMVPRWQDLWDVIAMFKWFFGMAERPSFDRWSYWQKFDYWAPFWGAAIIGFSGIMLFAPTVTTILLPGFVFNIATIIHGEEAILAVIFLFTVHFFNAHFRPDRFPMSTTIFTGAIPLDEFKHEHKLHYERLVASGELEKHLMKKPSKLVSGGSKLLGTILIMVGLGLLTLFISGYMTMH
ncbi:MAG: cytochrome C [gamma proteobacterium symbiont of Taylorina sp.]|nr:cytochrome C [gamma proteobacterium symbiont of Taylorina sp.]